MLSALCRGLDLTAHSAQLNGPLNSLGTLYRVIQSNLSAPRSRSVDHRPADFRTVDTDNLMKLLNEQKEARRLISSQRRHSLTATKVVDKEDAFELLKAEGEIVFGQSRTQIRMAAC